MDNEKDKEQEQEQEQEQRDALIRAAETQRDEALAEVERLKAEIARRDTTINDLIDNRHKGATADATLSNIKKLMK